MSSLKEKIQQALEEKFSLTDFKEDYRKLITPSLFSVFAQDVLATIPKNLCVQVDNEGGVLISELEEEKPADGFQGFMSDLKRNYHKKTPPPTFEQLIRHGIENTSLKDFLK
jgi:hypothetical protein